MMDCHETCADRGKRCALPRERISCTMCGKVKPCYNIQGHPCGLCPPIDTYSYPTCADLSQKLIHQSPETCVCKSTWWQWILSFLGVGGEMPECCRNVQLTVWESGELARQTLVSKVQSVVSIISGKEYSRASEPTPQPSVQQAVETAHKKTATLDLPYESDPESQAITDSSPEGLVVEEKLQPADEKKMKPSKLSNRKRKQRKGNSKSRSVSRERLQEQKVVGPLKSGSTSSTSLSQGRQHRRKSRSRSRSLVKVYNPFKTEKQAVKCPELVTEKPKCRSTTCPCYSQQPPRCFASDDQMSVYTRRYLSPSCQIGVYDRPLRRSNSISYKPYTVTSKTATGSSFECPCSNPKPQALINSNLQKYQCTPSRLPMGQSGCSPTKPLNTGIGQRASSCLCPSEYTKKLCSCCQTCSPALKPAPAYPRQDRTSCTCLKPTGCSCSLCQALKKAHITSNVKRPQFSSTRACCHCSPRAMTQRAHTSPISASLDKNNIICQQLLCKYGFSPPVVYPCPVSCYGNVADTICPPSLCDPMCYRPTYSNEFRFCRCCSVQCCMHRKLDPLDNLTNCRESCSPDGHCDGKQLIHFNESPSDRKPKCEFQLPPHCIRKTGPRSLVQEFISLLRASTPVQRTQHKLDTNVEMLPEQGMKPLEPGAILPQSNDESQVGNTKGPDGNAIILEANTTPGGDVKPAKKKLSRKKLRKASDAGGHNNKSANNRDYCNLRCVCVDYQHIESNLEEVSLEEETWPTEVEGCFNNNYGGDSYSCPRYRSAGPTIIDYSGLTSFRGRHSNSFSQTSLSSNMLPRYSGSTYSCRSLSSCGHDVMYYPFQTTARDVRQFSEPDVLRNSWYTDRTSSNMNTTNVQNHYANIHHGTTNKRTYVSDVSAKVKSRYHVQLENDIENKIKELRKTKVLPSPPMRKRAYKELHTDPRSRVHETFYKGDVTETLQREFIRESWDAINQRAFKRRNNSLSTYLDALTAYSKDLRSVPTNHLFSRRFREAHKEQFPRQERSPARGHHKHGGKASRENKTCTESKPPREQTKSKYKPVNKAARMNSNAENYNAHKKETNNHDLKDLTKSKWSDYACKDLNQQLEKQTKNVEKPDTPKRQDKKPTVPIDCVPVLQSIMDSFEETVQLIVRSQQIGAFNSAAQGQEEKAECTVETACNDDGGETNTQSSDSSELNKDNQSSNNPVSKVSNQVTLAAESSPPQKPLQTSSQEEQRSYDKVLTYSCHTNSNVSPSSVTLDVSHSAHSVAFSDSSSESESHATSLGYSKESQVSRSSEHQTREHCNKVVASQSTLEQSVSLDNECSIEENMTNRKEKSSGKVHEKSASLQNGHRQTDVDVGSSVDPSRVEAHSRSDNMPTNKNIGYSQFIQSAAAQIVDCSLRGTAHDCGDVACQLDSEASLSIDKAQYQNLQTVSKSFVGLNKLQINKNGTPV